MARLIQFGKLGGFHFNDSKYGDDDLDAGSINPFQLFLVFNELVDAELRRRAGLRAGLHARPVAQRDRSDRESLMTSAIEVQRAYVQALLVDREALTRRSRSERRADGAADAEAGVHDGRRADPGAWRARSSGGAIDPIATYRASGYREQVARERPADVRRGAGIV